LVHAGEADAGAIFAAPGGAGDARDGLAGEIKDLATGVKVVAHTGEVPNEPVVFRRGLPPETARKVAAALTAFAATPAGRAALAELSGITGLIPAVDADYDGLRETLRAIGKDVAEMVPGGWELAIRNEPLKLD
jgi:phosphonate transport system substrate-binding protein